jgi:ABC-2 type transport system permease protein
VLQAYVFLLIAAVLGVEVPLAGWLRVLPVLLLAGMMLGALGLLLSVHVKQLENFAGTMNFVIFPMFFLSSALYPLWKLEESGATVDTSACATGTRSPMRSKPSASRCTDRSRLCRSQS